MNDQRQLTVERLASLLPEADYYENKMTKDHCAHIQYVEEADERFVPPKLAVKREVVPGQTAVVLIEAPAAVGKSMLARDLARRINATVWNLGELNLGTATFTGVFKCFGVENMVEIYRSLKSGEYVVVLDALDEGRSGAGDENFLAFLENVSEEFQDSGQRPSVVIMSRGVSSEIATAVFDASESPVPFAHLRIKYFEEEEAKTFIDRRLDFIADRDNSQMSHRDSSSFQELRAVFFDTVLELLGVKNGDGEPWDNEVVRQTLGYAPFLEGVSEYLAGYEENYDRILSQLEKEREERGPVAVWGVLVEALDSILEREHDKKKKLFEERFEKEARVLEWGEWSTLYTANEQRRRVLAKSPALNLDEPNAPSSLPAELVRDYTERVDAEIEEHPFYRSGSYSREQQETDGFTSVLYRGDTFAWALATNDVDQRYKNTIRNYLRSKKYQASPFLCYSLVVRSKKEGGRPVIEAQDVGFLYESLVSKTTAYQGFHLNIYQTGEAGQIKVEFRRREDEDPLIEVFVAEDSGSIEFPRELSRAAIDVDIPVTLGTYGRDFYLGPEVEVRSSSIFIPSDLTVNTGATTNVEKERRYVVLEADEGEVPTNKPPNVQGEGRFQVCWEGASEGPWQHYAEEYQVETSDVERFGYDLVNALRCLGIRGWGAVDLSRVNRRTFSEEVVDTLFEIGVLERRKSGPPVAGDPEVKPLVNSRVRGILRNNLDKLERWELPEEVQELLVDRGLGN